MLEKCVQVQVRLRKVQLLSVGSTNREWILFNCFLSAEPDYVSIEEKMICWVRYLWFCFCSISYKLHMYKEAYNLVIPSCHCNARKFPLCDSRKRTNFNNFPRLRQHLLDFSLLSIRHLISIQLNKIGNINLGSESFRCHWVATKPMPCLF